MLRLAHGPIVRTTLILLQAVIPFIHFLHCVTRHMVVIENNTEVISLVLLDRR